MPIKSHRDLWNGARLREGTLAKIPSQRSRYEILFDFRKMLPYSNFARRSGELNFRWISVKIFSKFWPKISIILQWRCAKSLSEISFIYCIMNKTLEIHSVDCEYRFQKKNYYQHRHRSNDLDLELMRIFIFIIKYIYIVDNSAIFIFNV